MSTFFRYLASLALHLAWRRSGRGGSIPPIRLPGKSKHVDLPVIGTWQLMAAVWLLKKFWNRYGHDVKGHLATHANHLMRRAATILPDIAKAIPTIANAKNAATPSVSPAVSPNAVPTITAPAPTPRVAPDLKTQVLSPPVSSPNVPPAQVSPPLIPATQNGAPKVLPSGSLLDKLRGRS